eukprot:TRINITY_DN2893_c0_g1_i1.p1 TRINITY_DN2893_c0_g1~~TRINITY_DN2893_c0_g1_i1.p1  ORF type:complete len:518 (+),score=90.60 TRINITY_DN2893_c0_g1_i1:105-1658(+)
MSDLELYGLPHVQPSRILTPDEQEQTDRTVYVSNIDTAVDEQQMLQVFQSVGPVVAMRLCGDPSPSNPRLRFGFVEYETRDFAQASMTAFQNYQLAGHVLRVASAKAPINKNSSGTVIPGVTQLPRRVPLQGSLSPSMDRAEQISRTVYVGQLDTQLSENQIVEWFMTYCGPVSKSRMAGDSGQDTRFMFIEFSTLHGAQVAFQLSGSVLHGRQIKVTPAKNPIFANASSGVAAHLMQKYFPGYTSLPPSMQGFAPYAPISHNAASQYSTPAYGGYVGSNYSGSSPYASPAYPATAGVTPLSPYVYGGGGYATGSPYSPTSGYAAGPSYSHAVHPAATTAFYPSAASYAGYPTSPTAAQPPPQSSQLSGHGPIRSTSREFDPESDLLLPSSSPFTPAAAVVSSSSSSSAQLTDTRPNRRFSSSAAPGRQVIHDGAKPTAATDGPKHDAAKLDGAGAHAPSTPIDAAATRRGPSTPKSAGVPAPGSPLGDNGDSALTDDELAPDGPAVDAAMRKLQLS